MTNKSPTYANNRFIEPKLIIPSELYKKITFWVDESDFECSWLGTIDHDAKTNTFHVVDIFLLDQENSGASTDMDPKAISKLLYDERENPFDIRWWGHSHVKMDVFWSGTDMGTIETLSNGGWFISTVFNQKREMKTAFTMLSPLPIMLDNINTQIVDYTSEKERIEWKAEFDSKVKKCENDIMSKYHFLNNKFYNKYGSEGIDPDLVGAKSWSEDPCLDTKTDYTKNSQQKILEADSMPFDPFGDALGDDLNETDSPFLRVEGEFSQQEEDYLDELYKQYETIKEKS